MLLQQNTAALPSDQGWSADYLAFSETGGKAEFIEGKQDVALMFLQNKNELVLNTSV